MDKAVSVATGACHSLIRRSDCLQCGVYWEPLANGARRTVVMRLRKDSEGRLLVRELVLRGGECETKKARVDLREARDGDQLHLFLVGLNYCGSRLVTVTVTAV